MIRHFLNAKTKRELHMHVEQENLGVLTGVLCDANNAFYPAILIEVAPGSGIYKEKHNDEI
jgi:hypothetical protein